MKSIRSIQLLAVFLISTGFFWSDDEEKKLRQLHQKAEGAMVAHDFETAKEAYKELMGHVGVTSNQKYKVNWQTYIDLVLRYGEACEATHELEEGEKILTVLLQRHPPAEFLPKIQMMLSRLTAHKKTADQTYLEMKNIATFSSLENWAREDLSYFHALEYSLDSHYDALILKAKRYRITGYYDEAIAIYREILEAIEQRAYPKATLPGSLIPKQIRYRLAESYFRHANYPQTLSLIKQPQRIDDHIDQEMLYLAALCFREKREYEKALELFQQYAQSGHREDLGHFDQARFEIGLAYYRSGNLFKAHNTFSDLLKDAGSQRKPTLLAALYLARIHLEKGEFDQVEKALISVREELSNHEPLRYEFFFIRGEAAYQRGEHAIAKGFFERSLPPNQYSGRWIEQAKCRLGFCYLKLGDRLEKETKRRIEYFERAEDFFNKLLTTSEEEAAILGLAQLNLLYDKHQLKSEALKKVETLLSDVEKRFSLVHQHEALLLRAEAATTYEVKEKYYRRATDPSFEECPGYAEGWYLRGVNHFQEGLEQEGRYFDLAVKSFEEAFHLMEKKDRNKAAQVLKLEAKANFYRKSPLSSLALLEKLLDQFTEANEQREETLYLRGLIASTLNLPIAKDSLLSVLKEFPKGKYNTDVLYTLGTLYYNRDKFDQAKETFIQLAQGYPNSPFAPEAWFWAAEASEKLKEEAAELRGQVFRLYPSSERAAEAYFRQFRYADYLEGEPKALAHLNDFSLRFPNSPLLVVVNYLIGKNCESFDKKREAFEAALKSFQGCLEEGKIPEAPYIYFRYLTILELASHYLKHQTDLESAQRLLTSLVSDFSEEKHPLTSALKLNTSYPSLFEEGEYKLVECFLKQGKSFKAQKRLSIMLSHYEEAGINEGYFLAQVWKEQGSLALQCHDYETALRCFQISDECGQNHLSDEQKLALWILQSDCYRGKEEYDMAMRLLSKVINADVASPLRLKAMYARALIYEEQQRPELAVRQLEAMAKKGGEWAWQAQEKLRVNYGIE